MANNWKILGNYNYIAKNGITSGGVTGTQEAPIALSNTAIQPGANVIGAGSYRWPAGYQAGAQGVGLYADGHVRVIGDSTTIPQAAWSGGSVSGVYFDQFAGISLNYSNNIIDFYGCTFDLINQVAGNLFFSSPYQNTSTFQHCVFINCNGTLGGNNVMNFSNCLFINTYINYTGGGIFNIFNSYIDSTSGISISSGSFSTCNIDPVIVNGTPNRGIKIGAGAWSNGQNYAGATNMITQAPQFNSVPLRDFTLKSTSPHLALGIGPIQNTNSVMYSVVYTGAGADVSTANTGITSSISAPTVPLSSIVAGSSALQVNGLGGIVLKPVANSTFSSTFYSGVLTLDFNVAKEMGIVTPLTGFNMDSDFQTLDTFTPEIRNNNVIDYNNGTAGAADRKPNRLTFRMRWSTLANPDINNPIHWVSGSVWVEMEWFIKVTYNLSGYIGNGSVSFVQINSLPVLCRTYQIEITTRNNYGA